MSNGIRITNKSPQEEVPGIECYRFSTEQDALLTENQRLRELIAGVPWPPHHIRWEDDEPILCCGYCSQFIGAHFNNCPVAAFEAERDRIKEGK